MDDCDKWRLKFPPFFKMLGTQLKVGKNDGMKTEKERFQKQFSEQQWAKLSGIAEFVTTWDSNDLVKAGEIASMAIDGNEPDIKRARFRRRMKNAGLDDLLYD